MRLAITEAQAGERLDVVLGQALGSPARAQRLIDDGRVTVDGPALANRHRVRAGEVVEWSAAAPRPAPPDADVPFAVAYEDDALLVVDKPAGVVVHPAPGHRTGTLAQAVGGLLVHRLDRDTSGLLVVAKSEEMHRKLQDALRRRDIKREYLALVEGRPDARSGTIDAPIGRDRGARTVMSTRTDKPRDAVTHFEIEGEFSRTTLL